MSESRRSTLLAIAALIAGISGFAIHRLFRTGSSPTIEGERALRNLVLKDLHGKPQRLAQWYGNTTLINFWATWCEPCREEIPLLIKTQSAYQTQNLQIVGISIDTADKVTEFSQNFGINYPLVIAGFEVVELMRNLGNTAGSLPYTVIIDASGRIVSSHLGGYTQTQLRNTLQNILEAA